MAYENLDPQDKAICEALEAGKSDQEIKDEFGVEDEKLNQLRPVVEEAKNGGNSNTGSDTASDAGESGNGDGA